MKYYIKMETLIGDLLIVERAEKIDEIIFSASINKLNLNDIKEKETDLLKEAKKQLKLYFDGKLKEFNLPLNISSTPFSEKVYNALLNIKYGEVKSYKQIAEEVGNAKASRAVGNANNKNKIPIIIPCHRVIGSNKKMVGYAGGIDIKEKLLNLETE